MPRSMEIDRDPVAFLLPPARKRRTTPPKRCDSFFNHSDVVDIIGLLVREEHPHPTCAGRYTVGWPTYGPRGGGKCWTHARPHGLVVGAVRFEKEPSTCEKEPSTCEKEPSTCERAPYGCERAPYGCERAPYGCEKAPDRFEKAPSRCEKVPDRFEKEPS